MDHYDDTTFVYVGPKPIATNPVDVQRLLWTTLFSKDLRRTLRTAGRSIVPLAVTQWMNTHRTRRSCRTEHDEEGLALFIQYVVPFTGHSWTAIHAFLVRLVHEALNRPPAVLAPYVDDDAKSVAPPFWTGRTWSGPWYARYGTTTWVVGHRDGTYVIVDDEGRTVARGTSWFQGVVNGPPPPSAWGRFQAAVSWTTTATS